MTTQELIDAINDISIIQATYNPYFGVTVYENEQKMLADGDGKHAKDYWLRIDDSMSSINTCKYDWGFDPTKVAVSDLKQVLDLADEYFSTPIKLRKSWECNYFGGVEDAIK